MESFPCLDILNKQIILVKCGDLNAKYIVLSVLFFFFSTILEAQLLDHLQKCSMRQHFSSFVIHTSVICHLFYQSNVMQTFCQALAV